ncbi:MAG: copper chaperone PCu(A)C [Anaerolineae bacterium]
MKTYLNLITLLLLVVIVTACGGAAPTPAAQKAGTQENTITVSDLAARATTQNGAVYMKLTNNGQSDDALISVKTDVAKTAELHETKMGENDVMQMSPVPKISIPAGGSVTLQPGGLHVMLMGMQKQLAAGDKISLTLTFEKAGSQTVEAEVKEGDMMGKMEHNQSK